MVRAKGTNRFPIMPPVNISGMNMITVATVADVMGVTTSLVPWVTASMNPSPCCRWRYITSRRTILLSMTRPTAITMALKVRMLIVMLVNLITRKLMSKLNGMDIAVINEARKAIKKRNTMTMARPPPIRALLVRLEMLLLIYSD